MATALPPTPLSPQSPAGTAWRYAAALVAVGVLLGLGTWSITDCWDQTHELGQHRGWASYKRAGAGPRNQTQKPCFQEAWDKLWKPRGAQRIVCFFLNPGGLG